MMPEILNVLALLAVFITFYAWFGCVMFVDTPEGEEFFPSLVEAWWSYVL
jgi:two pore calcium channel protein